MTDPQNNQCTKAKLSDYLEDHSQQSLATALGYRQSAISNMLKSKRNITVVTHPGGAIELYEEKIISAQKSA